MDINNLNIEQLKSLAYDQIGELERVQNNLRALNARIATLQSEKKQEEPVQEEK